MVQKSGSWYSYGDDRIGQGKENAKHFLKDHPEARAELLQQLRDKLLVKANPAETAETADAEQEPVSELAK